MAKPIILVLTGYYLPGYRGGGPIRTIANMVDQLGSEYAFKIVALDRDLGSTRQYPDVAPGTWQRVGQADVYYISPQSVNMSTLRSVISRTQHDVLYLNSFFSSWFTIYPLLLRWMGAIPNKPVIVAPRGEFSPGAIAIKGHKKKLFIKVAKLLGLYRRVVWQASSEAEERDIRQFVDPAGGVVIAPDLRNRAYGLGREDRIEKETGLLRAVFVSRVSRKKNLDGALRLLQGMSIPIEFNIFGPIEDEAYWNECKGLIQKLPSHVKARYRGEISHEQVGRVFSEHDLFLFPTHGENYGHVILESLCAGCPVLISDQTPWRDLTNKGVGWDLPLDRPDLYQAALNGCAQMSASTFKQWSERAAAFGEACTRDEQVVEQNRQLFSDVYETAPKEGVKK